MKLANLTMVAVFATILGTSGAAFADDVPKATLPLVIYSEAGHHAPYSDSGYMGNHTAIKVDPGCTTNPHSGTTCMKVEYTAKDDWAGVVWQNPDNDWGDKPGGLNLTGAKKLTFWARGEEGGEVANFEFGVLTKVKKYPDSGGAKLDKTKLTKEWKMYTMDLTGVDLSCIKTGFAWAVAGSGKPVTFYLDDIEFE